MAKTEDKFEQVLTSRLLQGSEQTRYLKVEEDVSANDLSEINYAATVDESPLDSHLRSAMYGGRKSDRPMASTQERNMPRDTFISLRIELARSLEPIEAVAPRIDALLKERIHLYKTGQIRALTQKELAESNKRIDDKLVELHAYTQSL